jgi:hypothetical protein
MEIVIHCLNHMVMVCVMNKSRNHWLLSNALNTIINLIVTMKFEVNPFVDWNKIFDLFYVEFHMLNRNMRQGVFKVINFFEVFEDFLFQLSSQYVGFDVESMFL